MQCSVLPIIHSAYSKRITGYVYRSYYDIGAVISANSESGRARDNSIGPYHKIL